MLEGKKSIVEARGASGQPPRQSLILRNPWGGSSVKTPSANSKSFTAMDGQRPSSSGRRNRKRSRQENKPAKTQRREEPVLIAARRPNAPAVRPKRRFIAASATPGHGGFQSQEAEFGLPAIDPDGEAVAPLAPPVASASDMTPSPASGVAPRRAARIVQVNAMGQDTREQERKRLILRLLASEGRAAISRAANDLELAGFAFPIAQDVQLQLLEHVDEGRAFEALQQLSSLLRDESPIKRPLFEQRLKRLEESADEQAVRLAAAELRRAIRA